MQNPIISELYEHFLSGNIPTRVHPDRMYQPTTIIFEFPDGRAEQLDLKCDHQEFMKWWRDAGSFFRGLHDTDFGSE